MNSLAYFSFFRCLQVLEGAGTAFYLFFFFFCTLVWFVFISYAWIYCHCNNSLNPQTCFFNIILYYNMKLPLFGHFFFFFLTFIMANSGIRMPEQGLGVHALTARGPGSIPGWGSKDPDTAKKIKIKKICLKMANSVESAILLPFPDLTTVCSLVFILPNLFYLETYILAFLFFLFVFSCAIIMYIWFCCLFFFFFLVMPCGIWNLCSPTRDRTHAPWIGSV